MTCYQLLHGAAACIFYWRTPSARVFGAALTLAVWLLCGGMLSLLVGLLRGCVLSEEAAVGKELCEPAERVTWDSETIFQRLLTEYRICVR